MHFLLHALPSVGLRLLLVHLMCTKANKNTAAEHRGGKELPSILNSTKHHQKAIHKLCSHCRFVVFCFCLFWATGYVFFLLFVFWRPDIDPPPPTKWECVLFWATLPFSPGIEGDPPPRFYPAPPRKGFLEPPFAPGPPDCFSLRQVCPCVRAPEWKKKSRTGNVGQGC